MDHLQVSPPTDDEPVRQIAAAFSQLAELINRHWPKNDDIQAHRHYRVTLTELEKVYAYFVVHVGGYHS